MSSHSLFAAHQILSHFQCPLESPDDVEDEHRDETGNAPTCAYYELPHHAQARLMCPFGHTHRKLKSATPSSSPSLREIPAYICFNYLLGRCEEPRVVQDGLLEQVARCTVGFHPSMEELIDLEHFHAKLASLILTHDLNKRKEPETSREAPPEEEVYENPNDPTCTVCLEPIPWETVGNFGLLQNCQHIFCADCILRWQQRPRPDATSSSNAVPTAATRIRRPCRINRQCPMCRTESDRVLICQRLPKTAEEKARLFDLQTQCFKLQGGGQTRRRRHKQRFRLRLDSDEDVAAADNNEDDDDDTSSSSSSDSDSDDDDDVTSGDFDGISREFLVQLRAIMDHDRLSLWGDDSDQSNNDAAEDGQNVQASTAAAAVDRDINDTSDDDEDDHDDNEEDESGDNNNNNHNQDDNSRRQHVELEMDDEDESLENDINSLEREFRNMMLRRPRGPSEPNEEDQQQNPNHQHQNP